MSAPLTTSAESSVVTGPSGESAADAPGRRTLVHGTAWMMVGQASRLGFQLAAFVVLGRVLGPTGFGIFAGALALAAMLAPFAEFGGYSLVVRDVAARQPTRRAVGNGLLLAGITAPFAFAVLAALGVFVLPEVPLTLVLAVGGAVLVGDRVLALVQAANVANGALWRNATLEVVAGGSTLALTAVLLLSAGTVETWAWLYLLRALLVAAIALAWCARLHGLPAGSGREAVERLRPGASFALGVSAHTAQGEVDKAMLARLSTLEATGIYAVAQRIVLLAALPLNALMSALYPRFFRAGQAAGSDARLLARRLVPLTAGYGLLAGGALFVAAPLVPLVFGSGFEESARALRWLAPLLLLQGIALPFADALSGAGRQLTRARCQLLALSVNVGLNLWLIPSLGWEGAVIAAVGSYAVFLAALLGVRA